MAFDHEFRYVDTEDFLDFMEKHFPDKVADAYKKLRDGAAKADLWRVLVLQHYGGVYIDIDACLVWPLSGIIKPNDKEFYVFTRDHYTNSFLATQKNNPVFEEIINRVVDSINAGVAANVFDLTGPTIVTDVLENKQFSYQCFRYVCVQGVFTNEFYQYIDKLGGKWIHAKKDDLLEESTYQTDKKDVT